MPPHPDVTALLDVLNHPVLPEISINLMDALTRAWQLERGRHPTMTAQQFIELILAAGVIAEMDAYTTLIHTYGRHN